MSEQPIRYDYDSLKAGAQAMSQFGDVLTQMGQHFQQIHQQLKDHCAGDDSGIGAAVDDATCDSAEAAATVFAEGGRVVGQMGTRTDANAERTFANDQAIADSMPTKPNGILTPPNSSGPPPGPGFWTPPPAPATGPSTRIESVRPYDGDTGLARDDPRWQQAMEDNFPKDANGQPLVHADPRNGWVANGNDGGPNRPGRSTNCADNSRAFLESWYGRPTCAQPRTIDPAVNSLGVKSGERNGLYNMRDYAGATETVESSLDTTTDATTAYQNISSKLTAAGPGSAAVVEALWTKTDPDTDDLYYSGGHAINAVNSGGDIFWVDMQHNVVSHTPLYPEAGAVFSIILGPDGRPAAVPATR
ncbi:MAG TPA: toxin glutamine deamidase domain-containing protein [Actinocrinis sp.]|nr:toxin glutamine deamidase domain-containing protein [Actinocrinis sp.]